MSGNLVVVIGVMVTVFFALASVPVLMAIRAASRAKRLLEVTKSPLRPVEEAPANGSATMRVVLRCVHFVRTRLGFAEDEKIKQKLLAAGLRDAAAMDTYFAIRLIGPVLAMLAEHSCSRTRCSGSWRSWGWRIWRPMHG